MVMVGLVQILQVIVALDMVIMVMINIIIMVMNNNRHGEGKKGINIFCEPCGIFIYPFLFLYKN